MWAVGKSFIGIHATMNLIAKINCRAEIQLKFIKTEDFSVIENSF